MVGGDPLSVVDGVLLVQVDGVAPATSQQEETVRPGPGSVTVPCLLERTSHGLPPVTILPH